MRASALATIVTGIVVACAVNRASEDVTCSVTADCASLGANRQCSGGYCIIPNCPDDCTACDETARTCQVNCTGTTGCDGTITCPSGWACTVSCAGAGACNDVECASGSKCAITCSGDNACGDIKCENACQCDLDCVGAACGSKTCPKAGNGGNEVRCTSDGTTATECDSTRAAGCVKC